MNIVPNIKKVKQLDGFCIAESFSWNFADNTDQRVINAANRICNGKNGIPVYICHGNDNSENYSLTVNENDIKIEANGAAGAFYALSTLKMLYASQKGKIACCEINDAPDMSYRGFYQDATRGRIPTLDTLKKLADTMADYKLNSLQLYIEHTYEFKEYDFCRELGYLTKAEIQELDAYCKERFIELVPSLSCFGHLYHLLQSDKYKHLCELKDYIPTKHYYMERMAHHTINPLLDESFELITSLISQHMEAFTSNKFNICCDETFDLGRDVNSDKDKSELYLGFVTKLANYLANKGKTVMMWGDVVLNNHPEKLAEFPEDIVFLNWYYDPGIPEDRVAAFQGKKQIVCPGTSTWHGFHERTDLEEDNIRELTVYGNKYGAIGILNTNWGDLGNPASIDMAIYGLILGAASAWDATTTATKEFKDFVSEYHYGTPDALDILTEMSNACKQASWLTYNWDWMHYQDTSKEAFEKSQAVFHAMIEKIKNTSFKSDELKQEFLLAAQGDTFITQWSAAQHGHDVPSKVDFNAWLKEYKENWLADSKLGELEELLSYFTKVNNLAEG